MKKKTKLDQDDKMVIAAFDTEYEVETIKGDKYILKPLSVCKIGLLPRISKKLEELSELETFMILFWVSITHHSKLLNYLKDNAVEDEFYSFLDNFYPKDIEAIIEVTKQMSETTNAGVIEIDDDGEKK